MSQLQGSSPTPFAATFPRLCVPDNWSHVSDDPAPRAVRWARRADMFSNPAWTKWHYTEGNGFFTACKEVVVPFEVDGSPQECDTDRVNCKKCRSAIRRLAAVAESASPQQFPSILEILEKSVSHRIAIPAIECAARALDRALAPALAAGAASTEVDPFDVMRAGPLDTDKPTFIQVSMLVDMMPRNCAITRARRKDGTFVRGADFWAAIGLAMRDPKPAAVADVDSMHAHFFFDLEVLRKAFESRARLTRAAAL
jgi:hypothetical protein